MYEWAPQLNFPIYPNNAISLAVFLMRYSICGFHYVAESQITPKYFATEATEDEMTVRGIIDAGCPQGGVLPPSFGASLLTSYL